MSKYVHEIKYAVISNIFRHDATDLRDTGLVSISLPVREMSSSNLGPETGYVYRNSAWFFHSVQANTRVVVP